MPPPPLSPGGAIVTVIKTTITVTGKCADFDAAAAAQALATDLGVSVGQITVTTRCDGRRRRLLKVEAFAVDVEIVAESDAAVSQLVGSLEEAAAEVDFGEDFAVAAVAPPVTSTKAVGGPSPPPSARRCRSRRRRWWRRTTSRWR